MEDRVRMQLEKEHSKRFRMMCHKNENLTQQNNQLISFYNREKKVCNIWTCQIQFQKHFIF